MTIRRIPSTLIASIVALLAMLWGPPAFAAPPDPMPRLYLVAVGDAANVAEQHLRTLCDLIAHAPPSAKPGFQSVYVYRAANDDVYKILKDLMMNPAIPKQQPDTIARLIGALQTQDHECARGGEAGKTGGGGADDAPRVFAVMERVSADQPNTFKLSRVLLSPDARADADNRVSTHYLDVDPSDREVAARKLAVAAGIVAEGAAVDMTLTLHVEQSYRCTVDQGDEECAQVGAPLRGSLEIRDTYWLRAEQLKTEWRTTCESPADQPPERRWKTMLPARRGAVTGGRNEVQEVARLLYEGTCSVVVTASDSQARVSAQVTRAIKVEVAPVVVDVSSNPRPTIESKAGLTLAYFGFFPWSAPRLDERSVIAWFRGHGILDAESIRRFAQQAYQELRNIAPSSGKDELAFELREQIDLMWVSRGDAIGYDLLEPRGEVGPYVVVESNWGNIVREALCEKIKDRAVLPEADAAIESAAAVWVKDCTSAVQRLRRRMDWRPIDTCMLRIRRVGDESKRRWGADYALAPLMDRNIVAVPGSFAMRSSSWDGVSADDYLLNGVLPDSRVTRPVALHVEVDRAHCPFSVRLYTQTNIAEKDEDSRVQVGAEIGASLFAQVADLRLAVDIDLREKRSQTYGLQMAALLNTDRLAAMISGRPWTRFLQLSFGPRYDFLRQQFLWQSEFSFSWALGSRESARMGLGAGALLGGSTTGASAPIKGTFIGGRFSLLATF